MLINFHAPERYLQVLEDWGKEKQLTRSEIIRRMIDEKLESEKNKGE